MILENKGVYGRALTENMEMSTSLYTQNGGLKPHQKAV